MGGKGGWFIQLTMQLFQRGYSKICEGKRLGKGIEMQFKISFLEGNLVTRIYRP